MGLFFFVFHLFPRRTSKRGMERGVFPLSLFFVFIEVCCFVFPLVALICPSGPARPLLVPHPTIGSCPRPHRVPRGAAHSALALVFCLEGRSLGFHIAQTARGMGELRGGGESYGGSRTF